MVVPGQCKQQMVLRACEVEPELKRYFRAIGRGRAEIRGDGPQFPAEIVAAPLPFRAGVVQTGRGRGCVGIWSGVSCHCL